MNNFVSVPMCEKSRKSFFRWGLIFSVLECLIMVFAFIIGTGGVRGIPENGKEEKLCTSYYMRNLVIPI